MRRAQSRSARTYRCPLCGELLHAMSEHVLLAPEGDVERRRHAHIACVAAARSRGELPTQDEWLAAQPGGRSLRARLRRLLGRV